MLELGRRDNELKKKKKKKWLIRTPSILIWI